MMLDCEYYYEEYLEGKSANQVKTQIRKLWKQICHAGKMQYSDFEPAEEIHPTFTTQIDFFFTYYDRAIEVLRAEHGEIYQPTPSEIRYRSFIENMEHVSKITFSRGSYSNGLDECIVTFGDFPTKMRKKGYSGRHTEYGFSPNDARKLVDSLLDLHVGLWRKSYFLKGVLDGDQWDLTFEFSNGAKPRVFEGSNCYPYYFESVCDLFYQGEANE